MPCILGDQCQATSDCAAVSNSKCDTTCVCDDAFKVSGGSCIAKVLGDQCQATSDCAAVSNSKCDTTCDCDDAFKVSGGSCIAKAVNEIPCTAEGGGCENIDNALCDADTEKCQCSPNSVMNVATCEPNTAAYIRVGATTLVLSVFAVNWTMFR
ncbi:uncharacterized protein LOC128550018 [Mercenaria mercenaria]|uniref:uncharacterized protein LOC128550018 n=1 Tax=Mercenaria mercenaria TaxID=6596 RepID=UPI00234EC200|nr:uncharacterized protein LOC128550018 [Mercenaria mercenaria]